MTELLYDSITTIPVDSVTTTETTPPFYENMGFFQGDSLMHPEVKVGQTGFDGILRPYLPWRDEWVVIFVLLSFLLMAMIQKRVRKLFSSETKGFFLPTKNITRKEKRDSNLEQLVPILMAFILSIQGGLGVFVYMQKEKHLFLGQIPPYIFIGIYIAIWMLYFIFKNLMLTFVNWIFFDKTKRANWRKSYFFLYAAETSFFLFVIISTIFLNLAPVVPLWIILIIGLLIKFLHLYKTFLIFFPKIYGTLHLIVYFCTLEIMPLLAVLKILIRVTDELIVKF